MKKNFCIEQLVGLGIIQKACWLRAAVQIFLKKSAKKNVELYSQNFTIKSATNRHGVCRHFVC